jgi:hypothetical protein
MVTRSGTVVEDAFTFKTTDMPSVILISFTYKSRPLVTPASERVFFMLI